ALKLLTHTAEPAPASDGGAARTCPYKPFFRWTPEDRQETTARWWDLQAQYTVLLDALGWDVERIAELVGKPAGEIELTLAPAPPVRFHSEMNGAGFVRPREMQHAYQEVYGNTVQEITSGMLMHIYRHAAYAAEVEDEFAGLQDQMRHLERYH